ncbi:MAG: hypothetical protein ACK475_06815 [Bacteroidota bacterium]
MPTIADELQRYLQQQKQMHGSTLYVDHVDPATISIADANVPETIDAVAEVDFSEAAAMPVYPLMSATTLDGFHADISGCM